MSEATLRIGRSWQVSLDGQDPDGDVLTYTAEPLPRGAVLDAQRGVLRWEPTPDQEGRHAISFAVSDGRHAARKTFAFEVQRNRAPNQPSDHPLVRPVRDATEGAVVSEEGESSVIAWDPDHDDLTFVAHELPPGARLAAKPGQVTLAWTPTAADVGEHAVVVDVSDGALRSTVRLKILVIPAWARKSYVGWLLLGGGASSFLTHGSGELLVGAAFDATLVAIREPASRAYTCAVGVRDTDCHASHHRFYGQFEVLDSLRQDEPSMFTYGVGYSASFEWYPGRRYLIPHYGIEVGGLVRDDDGHLAQTRPYLGLHLWASDRIWVNAALGYRVVPAALSELSGPTFALGAVLNPW